MTPINLIRANVKSAARELRQSLYKKKEKKIRRVMEYELPNERPARQVLVKSMATSKEPVKAPFLQIIPGYTENPGEKALLQAPKDQRQNTQPSSALGYDCNTMEGGSGSGWDGS